MLIKKSTVKKRPGSDIYYYRRNVGGKDHRETLDTTNLKEAKEKKTKLDRKFLLDELNNNTDFQIDNIRFSEAMQLFIDSQKIDKAFATWNDDVKRLDMWLRFLGDVLIKDITEEDIKRFVNEKKDRNGNYGYNARNYLKVLKTFLRFCQKKKMIRENPFEYYKIKKPDVEKKALSIDDIIKIVKRKDYKRNWIRDFLILKNHYVLYNTEQVLLLKIFSHV